LIYGIPAAICFSFKERPLRFAIGVATVFLAVGYVANLEASRVLWKDRNFFGVNRVCIDSDKKFHTLVNGNTVHGLQLFFPNPSREPAGYYSRSGPLGDIFEAFSGPMLKRRVAIVGLGSGSIAAYAQPGQEFTFYEIDPAVAAIANDPNLFTYLRDCRGNYDVVLGDARIRLAEAPDGEFDFIVLDAFSSDSIPMHLLTQEAMDLYLRKLKANGAIAIHISNNFLRLEPVLGRLAAVNGLVCFSREDINVGNAELKKGDRMSHYLAMTRKESDLGSLTKNDRWHRVQSSDNIRVWTDDYSNILSILRW
jgi:spermidine synthase